MVDLYRAGDEHDNARLLVFAQTVLKRQQQNMQATLLPWMTSMQPFILT